VCRLKTLKLSLADCYEIWEPQSPGTLRACKGIDLLFLLNETQCQYLKLYRAKFKVQALYMDMRVKCSCHGYLVTNNWSSEFPGITQKHHYQNNFLPLCTRRWIFLPPELLVLYLTSTFRAIMERRVYTTQAQIFPQFNSFSTNIAECISRNPTTIIIIIVAPCIS